MENKPNTIIESLGVYLPPKSFPTDEVLQNCKTPIRFPLEKITGIKTRRMAGKKEFAIDLARKAVQDCLEKSKYQSADIDLLICCNISRYDGPEMLSFEPCTSIKLKKLFGFKKAIAFDITNACAGMFTGILIADALLKSGAIQRGLVVSGEYITHLTHTAQKEIESYMDSRLACLTLGDAGAAVILENGLNNKTGFQQISLQTFGRYSPYCIAKEAETGGWIMHTDSVNLTDVAIKSGAKYALDILEKSGWSPEKFEHLIMHQTSRMTLNSARNEINTLLKSKIFHDGNTINNLEQRGNTASTSHLVAIADQIQNNNIQSGDKVVFSISASGLTVGTALYVFDNFPDRLRQEKVSQDSPNSETVSKNLTPDPHLKETKIRIESVGTIPKENIEKKDSMEMLLQAASNCLEQSSYENKDIELLIYCGVYRSEYLLEPAYAALLAGKLDMNATLSESNKNKTFAFDIFNGSTGFFNACFLAQEMIKAGNYKTVMVVASEIENNAKFFPDKQIGICETASAIILDAHPNTAKGLSNIQFNYQLESIDDYTANCAVIDTNVCMFVKKSPKLEEKYIANILISVNKLLEKEGLELDQIDMVVPPQISSGFISQLSKQLSIPLEKFIDVVGDGPDVFSSSIPLGINEAYKKNLVHPGNIGLIINVGSGIQVASAIYHF